MKILQIDKLPNIRFFSHNKNYLSKYLYQKLLKVKIYIFKYKIYLKFIFCSLLLIFIIFTFNYKGYIITYQKDEPQFYFRGKRQFLTKETIYKFNSYMNICQKGILVNKAIYNLTSQPKISVIMPIYNAEKYLHYSLRSIQNQKMKDIEIILIDDCSKDNSVEIIEKYMKEDPRIRLIKNEKNRKILYCKSISALNAKGKYILELDQDDMFISDDAFETIYKDAEDNNLDLLQFRDFILEKFHFEKKVRIGYKNKWFIYPGKNQILTQPYIKNSFFHGYNFLLWGLLIKTDIYKKAVYNLWSIVINYQIINFEDYTMTFMIVLLAKRFKFLNNFYIIHLEHINSVTISSFSYKEYCFSQLLMVNNLIDYHLNNNLEDMQMVINTFKVVERDLKYSFPNLFEYTYKKIFEYNNITNKQKKLLNEKYKYNNTEFNKLTTYEYIMNSTEYNSIFKFQNLINDKENYYNDKHILLNPRYSIIVYCNQIKYLENTINSIRNQNYDNYEIILIYDNNNITELESIELLIKKSNIIKLINNMEEKGLLYSYSKSILECKGEYILTIQSGYTLATEHILNDLNNNIDDNIGVLEFNLLINNQENIRSNSLRLYKCLHFKSKINMDLIKFNKNYKEIDQEKELITNKLIKSDIYKKIIKNFKDIFENKKLYYYYDDIIFFLIKNITTQFRHINNFGIIQYKKVLKNFESEINIKDNNQLIQDTIYYINFLFDFSKNIVEEKEFVINEFFNYLNIIYNKFNILSLEAKLLIDKFLNCKYISQFSKNSLRIYYESLIN